jgi:DNA repair exonuclease SbcCD nuclease subunit
MLHTTLDKAKGTLPIDSISTEELPKMDYYALGHLHIDFQYENFVYPGPIFPNNFQELEDLKYGSFYIVETSEKISLEKIDLKLKEVEPVIVSVSNAPLATDKIIQELSKRELQDKVVLLRVKGELENGTNSDIKFNQIEDFAKSQGAYFLLRNTHELKTKETEVEIEVKDSENIEQETLKIYSNENPSDFNKLIPDLMNVLSIEKQEGEKTDVFNTRLLESTKKILNF